MNPGRLPLVVSNWKMNKSPREAAAFAEALLVERGSLSDGVAVALAPPFTALDRVGRLLAPSRIALVAQDVHTETHGAFTGEISAAMLKELGVSMTLVGHSERRRDRREDETDFARKMRRLAEVGIAPLYCVGETLEARDAGDTERVLVRQMTALEAFPDSPPPGLTLAYEPVWAIGTGRAATPQMAQEAHRALRDLLAGRYGDAVAEAVRILYGGSVTPKNAASLFAGEDVDGALVGGASLILEDLLDIVRAAV